MAQIADIFEGDGAGPCRSQIAESGVTLFDLADGPADPGVIAGVLADRGVVILRNLFESALMDDVRARAREWLSQPAIAGTIGYAKVDAPKRLLHPSQIGGPVVEVMVNETVLDIVERRMDSECILAEAILKFDRGVGYEYFPLHADFTAGWNKGGNCKVDIGVEEMAQAIGIGGVLYLEDAGEGAFSYCEGTHHLMAPRGQDLRAYPEPERSEIRKTLIRCDGRAGDLVLFDDRGFHGPDQPSRKDRTVILLDYYRVKTFGRVQTAPMPIWTSDLGRLNARQLRAIGAGAESWHEPSTYRGANFRSSRAYKLASWVVDNAYAVEHIKRIIRTRLGI